MAYHPLANDTGGDAEQRRAEANRLLTMLRDVDWETQVTLSERRFLEQMASDDVQPVSPKQVFWLRDIKDKYL